MAEPGKILLGADYSQIELRVMAHFSNDPVLLEAFRTGQDIHERTAQEVFGVGPMAQTAEHRRASKAINYGIIYGLSPFGLAQQIGVPQKEAAQFIHAYFERYRGVKQYLDNVLAETRQTGLAKTLFGRIRPIPDITSPQVQIRNFAERTALNSPLQGTAADLIKLAMIAIHQRLMAEKFEAKMILQVHDELLFEAPASERGALEKLVRHEMENVHKLAVPLVVEIWPEIAAPLHASLGHPAGVESAHKLAEPLLRPIPVGRRRYEDISVGPGRGSARGLWRVSCPAKHAGKS